MGESYLKVKETDATIVGTLEAVYGTCPVRNPGKPDKTGRFVFEQHDGTRIDWNSQKTVIRDGQRVFVDDNDQEYLESELELFEAKPAKAESYHFDHSGLKTVKRFIDEGGYKFLAHSMDGGGRVVSYLAKKGTGRRLMTVYGHYDWRKGRYIEEREKRR